MFSVYVADYTYNCNLMYDINFYCCKAPSDFGAISYFIIIIIIVRVAGWSVFFILGQKRLFCVKC